MVEWRSTGNITEITDTISQLDSLRSRGAALGCPIMPGSRIASFEQHLRRFLDPAYHPRSDPEFDPTVLAHGSRDLFELNFICDKLAGSHPTQLRAALPHLLSGPVVPQEKGRNEMPRNLQFQFFLAAQLAHSGFPVTLDEPDAVFVHEGVGFGLAVKRPGSERQVIRRIREGVNQLGRRGVSGFVALSLDRLLRSPNPYVIARGPAALDHAAQALLRETFAPYAREARKAVARTTITGLIISLTVVGCVRVPWQAAHTTATLWVPREDDLPHEEALVRSVYNVLKGPTLPSDQ